MINLMHKHKGIGLLELMLALVVIAVILVSGLRYYQVVRQSNNVNVAVSMVKLFYVAAETWHSDGLKFTDASGIEGGSKDDPLLEKFAQINLLPATYEKPQKNPWGGDFTAADDTTDSTRAQAQLTLTKVPKAGCLDLKDKLEGSIAPEVLVSFSKCQEGVHDVTLLFDFGHAKTGNTP